MKRILLADRNPDVRSALRLLLETRLGFVVVAETSTLDETLTALAHHQPDILFVDSKLPGLTCPSGLSTLRGCAPATRLFLSYVRPEDADWINNGLIDGIINKSDPPDHLLRILQTYIK